MCRNIESTNIAGHYHGKARPMGGIYSAQLRGDKRTAESHSEIYRFLKMVLNTNCLHLC